MGLFAPPHQLAAFRADMRGCLIPDPVFHTNLLHFVQVTDDVFMVANTVDDMDLAEKMIFLYENDDVRNSYAQAGLERAIKYFDRPIMLHNILIDMKNIIEK